MNCHRYLQDYYTDLASRFHHLHLEVLENRGKETVHDLRVVFKKKVAFYKLLEHLDPAFSWELALTAYGKLYRRAGKVRDLEVEQALIRKKEMELDLEHFFSSLLENRELKAFRRLQHYETEHSLASVRHLEQIVLQHLRRLSYETLSRQLIAFFATLIQEIDSAIRDEESVLKALHPLRKMVKTLYYNLLLIKDLLPPPGLRGEFLNTLDRLQDDLGDWHDIDCTLALLKEDAEAPSAEVELHLRKEHQAYLELLVRQFLEIKPLLSRLNLQIQDLLVQIHCDPAPSMPPTELGSLSQVNLNEGFK